MRERIGALPILDGVDSNVEVDIALQIGTILVEHFSLLDVP